MLYIIYTNAILVLGLAYDTQDYIVAVTRPRAFKEVSMKRIIVMAVASVALCSFAAAGAEKEMVKAKSGEELFKQHCAVCHADGGNIINPAKTLHKKDREANNIKKAGDIVGKMRNPGPGMTKFDKATISDKDAGEIAKYILKTFK